VTVKVLSFWDVTPCSLVRVKVRVKLKVSVKVKVKFSPVTCHEEHRKEITVIILLINNYCVRKG